MILLKASKPEVSIINARSKIPIKVQGLMKQFNHIVSNEGN